MNYTLSGFIIGIILSVIILIIAIQPMSATKVILITFFVPVMLGLIGAIIDYTLYKTQQSELCKIAEELHEEGVGSHTATSYEKEIKYLTTVMDTALTQVSNEASDVIPYCESPGKPNWQSAMGMFLSTDGEESIELFEYFTFSDEEEVLIFNINPAEKNIITVLKNALYETMTDSMNGATQSIKDADAYETLTHIILGKSLLHKIFPHDNDLSSKRPKNVIKKIISDCKTIDPGVDDRGNMHIDVTRAIFYSIIAYKIEINGLSALKEERLSSVGAIDKGYIVEFINNDLEVYNDLLTSMKENNIVQ